MKMIAKWLCQLFGHDWTEWRRDSDPQWDRYWDIRHCRRCRQDEDRGPFSKVTGKLIKEEEKNA